jgi:hypothetical protein
MFGGQSNAEGASSRHWRSRGGGVRGGVFLSPLREGSWRGYKPSPGNFLIFHMEIVPFGAFWGSKVESCIG